MKLLSLSLLASLLSLSSCGQGKSTPQQHADHAAPTEAQGSPDTALKAGVKAYPLDTCIVSDEKLGEMGDPVIKIYGDQEIKFCCKSCIKKFEKDQAKYLKKLPAK